ncbi:MAG TPA: hypothetical protein V6D27_09870 [Vampirovibrionales bacterium]
MNFSFLKEKSTGFHVEFGAGLGQGVCNFMQGKWAKIEARNLPSLQRLPEGRGLIGVFVGKERRTGKD